MSPALTASAASMTQWDIKLFRCGSRVFVGNISVVLEVIDADVGFVDVIDGTFVVVIPDLSQRLIGRQTVLSIRTVCFSALR